MSLWSRIKVELFNLGFVERNNNPLSFVFFFFFYFVFMEFPMQKLYYWKTYEIFEYIFDFYLWFYIKFILLLLYIYIFLLDFLC